MTTSLVNEILRLAQARTGTGKTLAFLIPVIQNIINHDPSLQYRETRRQTRGSADDIRAIIISPTRELAEQIAVEAQKVTKKTGVIVQTAVGGSAKQHHLRQMRSQGCHILVGTPGRLNDILSDPRSGARAPNLRAFVLDEADRLLDQGFAPEIRNIESSLPNRREIDRQTLLYSATVPDDVMHIVRQTMKPDFKFVRTVQKGEQQTHEKVPQKQVVVKGLANTLPALLELCTRELAQKDRQLPFKAIVYFGATAEVILASQTFQNLKIPGASVFHRHPLHPARIIEMHARLRQHQRTKAAEDFRRAESAIMFSSDVTARGMDFPNVSHVIQIGLPPSKEAYVHRIGRTGRGDKPGEGWLIISDFEADEVRYRLDRLPIKLDESLETADVDMSQDAQLPEHVAKTLTQIIDASRTIHIAAKSAAYLANLGYYQWLRHKQDLVDSLNDRSRYCWALEEPPRVPRDLQHKLGLARATGLNVVSGSGYEERGTFQSSESGQRGLGRERSSSGGFDTDRYPQGRQRSDNGSYNFRDREGGRSRSFQRQERGPRSSNHGHKPRDKGYGFKPHDEGYGFKPHDEGYGFKPRDEGYGRGRSRYGSR